jgi:mono/diheme cytochrome c family protein
MRVVSVIAAALVGFVPAAAAAQGPGPALPPEVQTWMNANWQQRFGQLVRIGDSLYNNGSCQRCHGQNGVGGRNGPALTDTTWVQSDGSLDGIFQTIFWGVRRRDFHDTTRRFEMNPAGGMNLDWDQMRAVTAYVWSLSRAPR